MAAKKPTTRQDTTLPVIIHLLAFFTGFLGPLIILLVTRDDHARRHAKAALNWQFSTALYSFISVILLFTIIFTIPAILVLCLLGFVNLVFCIIAAVYAHRGECWRYPLAIPFFDACD